jgi:hypothetical protein
MISNIDPFYVICSAVGLVAWFARLEAKTNRNEKDIEKMETKQEVLEKEVVKELSNVRESLSRIEGRLVHLDP